MNQARWMSMARLFFPTGFPRQEVLEKVSQELGLRLLEDGKSKDSMLINCLNGEVQKQALGLEGLALTDHVGRIVGQLSTQPIH